MTNTRIKRFLIPWCRCLVAAFALGVVLWAVLLPEIAIWEAASLEIDHSLTPSVSIEAQIRAIEKLDPHKEFLRYVRDHNLFLYAIADNQVIVPGVERVTMPYPFPIRVIAGTGESKAGKRGEHLNQIAHRFAEQFNEEMHGYIVTW
jgi:hypothetical protein